MKAIILAGGFGTRLSEETGLRPKPMVEIGGKPILWHIMKIYSAYGINDFIICCGYKSYVIKEYFANYFLHMADITFDLSNNKFETHRNTSEPWKVTLIDTGINTLKGGRIKRIEKFLDSDINLLTYGDGVADIDILKLIDFHKSHGKILTITGVHAPSRFGEISEKNGKILLFREKPQTSGGLINGGFMIFNKEFLNYLTPDEDCDLERGPFEELAAKGQIMIYKHEGNWGCMDHERDVEFLNDIWYKNKAYWKIWE